ncbi:MAG: MetQ/NlpA family ABC transporter substrate-binding protein [Desulfopila sp.]|nr:MetQ/NlpA family ABC transporter substrate-binding protein [Desulfopila sp.]
MKTEWPYTVESKKTLLTTAMKQGLIILCYLFYAACAQAGMPLKIGVLLIEDAVPLYVAEQEAFFAGENIEVELIPFLSALERDSALAAAAIDGAITDPMGAILFDKGRGMLKITSLALGKTSSEGIFAVLASPKSSIKEVGDLKNVAIAISNATIIEYVTERLLENHGFTSEEIKTIEVKKMPIRMQMLLSDSVDAATLPEPLASIAVAGGARLIVSDAVSKESLSQTVMVFRTKVLDERKNEVAAFFRALQKGISAINTQPETYRELFVEKGRIPPFLAREYVIPQYPHPEPFSRSLYDPVVQWLVEKKLVEPLPYETMVSTDFRGE